MNSLTSAHAAVAARLEHLDWLIPTLARVLFAAILLVYFLNAGMTKLGDGFAGLWTPSTGAYAQIFPKAFEAVGYDAEALSLWHRVVVVLGTWAEFVLPALIVLGLLTRLAALGMIGFVVVQSLTDVYGHGQTGEIGAWFDRFPDAIMLDQRALWVFLFVVLVIKGAGPLSFDRAIRPTR
ncbi:DoxX family protein [Sulfitobacter aestuariivivens]|uniref:DoxX family protein n=1 Tax=Sulfitobacter aestuariivivens TaxID=2766981 RepID=A0A927HDX7_9RHOB|nr:DoxX family protein [Sulfitobacter aestuariivivens]MBD3662754.1 DoxX family protein [Sulfitobacter aestuariivivens]